MKPGDCIFIDRLVRLRCLFYFEADIENDGAQNDGFDDETIVFKNPSKHCSFPELLATTPEDTAH
ncbi:hypothetical protein [Marinobacterium mangrovicola]|uniref:hypothetical protein n=1 Tax=Marinobacterium mangrovicola TaxID=1476959 RepID=UPI00104F6B44|nr:hypothetical protein [Marinobacterium mangrovicola]